MGILNFLTGSDAPNTSMTDALGGAGASQASQLDALMQGYAIAPDGSRGQVGVSPTGQSLSTMLGNQAVNPYVGLDPANNPALQAYTQSAGQAANGQLAARMGGSTAAQLQQLGSAAAGRIPGAGQDVRAGIGASAAVAGALNGMNAQDLAALRTSAAGGGPSVANQLARAQAGQNMQAAGAQLAAARGGNVAAAMHAAQMGLGNSMLQTAIQRGQGRSGEQAQAQQGLVQGGLNLGGNMNGLTGALNQTRAADINQATSTAGAYKNAANNATSNYNVGAGLVGAGMSARSDVSNQYQTQLIQQQQAQEAARMDYAKMLQQQFALATGVPVSVGQQAAGAQIANRNADMVETGAALSAAGSAIGSALRAPGNAPAQQSPSRVDLGF